jgi:cell cycle arrest protein BUB2
MPSPVKESIPSLQPLPPTQLHAPPSPGTHRALRRLQSAHSLGAKAANQPSLISQQRLQQLSQHQQLHPPTANSPSHNPTQGNHQPSSGSPVRRNVNNRSPQRNRANSDANANAPVVHQANSMQAPKRSVLNRRSTAADNMSLDRLLRDGPPGGDVAGALESARLKILDQGIKSDSDGMVCPESTCGACLVGNV